MIRTATLLAAITAATVVLVVPLAGAAGRKGASASVPASISGVSYEDADGDGARDGGEPGVGGFSVFIDLDDDGELDVLEPTETSAADGTWSFDAVAPGSYRVRQAPRDGWICSAPQGCQRQVDMAGADVGGRDFGAWRPGRILGTVFEDRDGSGARGEGEPPQSRRTLYLDRNGDADQDTDEPTAVSGVDGSYSFDWLRPGTWTVREVLPAGWRCTAPSPCAHTVALRSHGEVAHRDFGNVLDPEPDAVVPVLFGTASLSLESSEDGGESPALGYERDPESGAETYMLSSSDECVPLRLDIPVDAGIASLLGVRLIVSPADGSDGESILLTDGEPDDGTWSGSIACARASTLEVVAETAAGETRVPAGEIVLIDPAGTVYDEQLYAQLVADGATPEVARCGSALGGARVTLQREGDERFFKVPPDDAGLVPPVNSQESDPDGTFRWDVSEGNYRVRVIKDGYHAAFSRTVSVPPPVLDLHVAMKRRRGTEAPEPRDCGQPDPPAHGAAGESCLLRPVNARVRGKRISHVIFYLDGRRLKVIRRPDRSGRFGVTVQRRKLGPGKHLLRAKVVFDRSARRRPAFLRLPIERCGKTSHPTAVHARPRCGAKPFRAWVRGARISRVVFRLDGRRLRSVSVADWRGRYAATVDPRGLAKGRHVLTARVVSVTSSGSRARTLRLSFTKCR